jgi:hypothetical protein
MQVFVDDQPVTVASPTLAAALAAAKQSAHERGRVVIDAVLDGVSVPDELLSSPTQDEFVGSDVRFATADPALLVGETLRGVADALEEAKADHVRAAELIQQGRIEDAMNRLTVAFGVWEQARTAVINGSALLGVALPAMRTDEIDAEKAVADLAGRLGEIKRAFVAQDWSGLSDILAYDMPEQGSAWQRLLRGIAERVVEDRRARG